jgi:hypothetical protein
MHSTAFNRCLLDLIRHADSKPSQVGHMACQKGSVVQFSISLHQLATVRVTAFIKVNFTPVTPVTLCWYDHQQRTHVGVRPLAGPGLLQAAGSGPQPILKIRVNLALASMSLLRGHEHDSNWQGKNPTQATAPTLLIALPHRYTSVYNSQRPALPAPMTGDQATITVRERHMMHPFGDGPPFRAHFHAPPSQ